MESAPSASKYLLAGKQSLIGTERWEGDVIFSADAIYILQSRRIVFRRSLSMFEKLADRVLEAKALAGSGYKKIPGFVKNDPAWPVKETMTCPVVIVPRTSVEFLGGKASSNRLRLIYQGVQITIPHDRFEGKGLKTFLEANGWPMLVGKRAVNLSPEQADEYSAKMRAGMFSEPHLSPLLFTVSVVLIAIPLFFLTLPKMNQPMVATICVVGWGLALMVIGFAMVVWGRGL